MSERFAVLDHDWPSPHRDLLLQSGGILRAWRLPAEFDACAPVLAEANSDHRLEYLDYEGPVSGERGRVKRWDSGRLTWLLRGTGHAEFVLEGQHLTGRFAIHQLEGTLWRLQWISPHQSTSDFE